MAIYVQTPNGLYHIGSGQVISGQVTKSKIIEALGYTPSAFDGDYNSLNNKPEIIEDGSDNFYIVDTQGNIIFKVDSNGIHSVNLTLDGKTIDEIIQESTPNTGDGTSGEDGREVELQVSSTHIQWRYVGDSTWIDLVLLADLKGDDGSPGADGVDGKSIELRVNSGNIEWCQVGGSWVVLMSLEELANQTPRDYNDLKNKPEILEDESDELSIVDSQGNIVAKITSEGIQAVNFLVGADEVALAKDIPEGGSGEYELTKTKIDTALLGLRSETIQLGTGATALGTSSTALGAHSSASGNVSTALGMNARAEGFYSTALGYNAKTGNSENTIQLGHTDLATLKSQVQLTVVSDIRDKADIEEVPKALDFIKDLNPITYVKNDRDNYISDEQKETETYKDYLMVEDYDKYSHSQGTKKGKRRRVGLSAQEVRDKLIEHYGSDNYANVVNDNFVEFEERGLDIPEGLENKLTMSYETMVPFLIKAIQEQQEQIEELKKKINKE